jgi:hypothetical protein
MDICDEQGGINFQLIRCLEEADRLCEEIVLNPWELEGIDEYYHKMERRLDSCQISLSCAFATVCVTLNCMTNLPEPVYQLAHDLRGLIIGEGNNLYNNLQQSACRKDIRMSGFMYGDIPPIPKEVLELAELKDSNAQLTKEVIYYKRKIHTMEEEKKCNCGPDCTCGCQEGKECTCTDENCNCGCNECNCGPDCECGCQEGKECSCNEKECNCEK